MLDYFLNFLDYALGYNSFVLNSGQMATRAVIVYLLALLLIRLIKRRFFAKPSPFDLVLLFLLGSVISRAISGNVPFFPTLVATTVLVLLHTLFSFLTFYSTKIGAVIKGIPVTLIEDGKINWKQMKKFQITQRDLMSALRKHHCLKPSQVKFAVLERDGEISVIGKKSTEIVDIEVEPGTQIIKIKIES